MVITRSDPITIASLKRYLKSKFEMKDLGFLCYFFLVLRLPLVAILYLRRSTLLIFLSTH